MKNSHHSSDRIPRFRWIIAFFLPNIKFAALEPSKRQSNYVIDVITRILYNFLGKETFRKFEQSMTKPEVLQFSVHQQKPYFGRPSFCKSVDRRGNRISRGVILAVPETRVSRRHKRAHVLTSAR